MGLEDMHRVPGVRKTFDLDDARRSYFQQLFPLNPSRIITKTSENIGLHVSEDAEFASKVFVFTDPLCGKEEATSSKLHSGRSGLMRQQCLPVLLAKRIPALSWKDPFASASPLQRGSHYF